MYRRQQPEPLPFQRNFRVRLPHGHLLIATTRLMVTVHHFPTPRAKPDFTMHFLVSDNPELSPLLHPVDGWDLLGLVRFLWRKIDVLKQLDLRDEKLREQLGLRTVSVPSQTRVRQEKRSTDETIGLICEFVLEHPNCTRLQIARGINRSKNPFLLTQIEWLVHTGKLARAVSYRPNGAVEYQYIFVGDNAD